VAQTRLVRRYPSLLAQQMAVHAALERDLADEVGRRTDDPVRARLMAAGFLAALRTGVDIWLERQGADPMADLVDRSLVVMGDRFS
jgi:hypothetical protein